MDPNALLSASTTSESSATLTALLSTLSFGDILNVIGNALGFVAMIGGLIYIGRKLQVLDHLDKTMDKVKGNVKVIGDFLISSELPFDGGKLQSYSPIQITNDGKEYLQTVGFTDVFSAHAADFYASVDQENPTGDFDIEAAAIRSVIQLFDSPYFAPIKDYFYNHPSDDRRAFFRIAGIYVRDKYMEHKKTLRTHEV